MPYAPPLLRKLDYQSLNIDPRQHLLVLLGSGDILCGNEGGDGLAPSLCHVTGNLASIIRLPSRSEIDTGNTGPLIGLPGLSFFRHNGSPPHHL